MNLQLISKSKEHLISLSINLILSAIKAITDKDTHQQNQWWNEKNCIESGLVYNFVKRDSATARRDLGWQHGKKGDLEQPDRGVEADLREKGGEEWLIKINTNSNFIGHFCLGVCPEKKWGGRDMLLKFFKTKLILIFSQYWWGASLKEGEGVCSSTYGR